MEGKAVTFEIKFTAWELDLMIASLSCYIMTKARNYVGHIAGFKTVHAHELNMLEALSVLTGAGHRYEGFMKDVTNAVNEQF